MHKNQALAVGHVTNALFSFTSCSTFFLFFTATFYNLEWP